MAGVDFFVRVSDILSMKCKNVSDRQMQSEAEDYYISCGSCNRLNSAAARFCGGCGKALVARKIAMVSGQSGLESFAGSKAAASQPASEKKASGTLRLVFAAAGRWFNQLKHGLKGLKITEGLRPWFNRRQLRRMAAVGAVSLSIVLSVMLKGSFSHRGAYVAWGDFRHHVSQKFVIAPQDLDQLFGEINAGRHTVDAPITAAQAEMLETALKQRYGDAGIKLFPNSFFGSGAENGHGLIFSDVPLDHPVYIAIKPLMELGVNCADRQARIRPYDPMNWSDWEKTVNQLNSLLGMGEEAWVNAEKGDMSREDLRFALASLRRQFFVGGIEKLDGLRGSELPSRLESLSALSMILNDLNRMK